MEFENQIADTVVGCYWCRRVILDLPEVKMCLIDRSFLYRSHYIIVGPMMFVHSTDKTWYCNKIGSKKYEPGKAN